MGTSILVARGIGYMISLGKQSLDPFSAIHALLCAWIILDYTMEQADGCVYVPDKRWHREERENCTAF
jgi:hypothetical protein